jgi:Tfp pilus assembly protein FimV
MTNTRYVVLTAILVTTAQSGSLNASMLEAEKALQALLSDVQDVEVDLAKSPGSETHDKTQYGDTLDEIIIEHVAKMPIRRDIVKRAIVHANPHAFKRSNPNWMYSGRKIKLPDAEDIRNLIFTDEAKNKMARGKNRDEWIRYP